MTEAPRFTPEALAPATPSERRIAWVELGVVLTLGVAPYLLTSVVSLIDPRPASARAPELTYLESLVWSLPACVCMMWIMHRSALGPRTCGLVWPIARVDLALGVLITGLFWVTSFAGNLLVAALSAIPGLDAVRDAVPSALTERYFAAPSGAWATALFLLYTLFATATEELVLRGYLIPRLSGLLGSTWLAILISSALGASYHIYQGSASMFAIFFAEILTGIAYVKVRRLWGFMLGHAAYDILLIYMYYT